MDTSFVFSGGSTKVPLHIGAIRAIEESGLKPIAYYGTSAGAIVSACLAYGWRYSDLYKLALSLDFVSLLKSKFIDLVDNVFSSLALVKGDKFDQLYDEIFGDITFSDLLLPCYIIGHCLDTCSYEVFSQDITPNMKVKDAVRISSSVPMLIKPVVYNNKTYVDGGLSHNFPVDLVPNGQYYIGHLIQSPVEVETDNIVSFGFHLIDQLITSNATTSINKAHKQGKTVISEYPLKTTQFDVPLEDKLRMIELGYNNMKKGIEYHAN